MSKVEGLISSHDAFFVAFFSKNSSDEVITKEQSAAANCQYACFGMLGKKQCSSAVLLLLHFLDN